MFIVNDAISNINILNIYMSLMCFERDQHNVISFNNRNSMYLEYYYVNRFLHLRIRGIEFYNSLRFLYIERKKRRKEKRNNTGMSTPGSGI